MHAALLLALLPLLSLFAEALDLCFLWRRRRPTLGTLALAAAACRQRPLWRELLQQRRARVQYLQRRCALGVLTGEGGAESRLHREPAKGRQAQRARRQVHHSVERVGGGEVALDAFEPMVAEQLLDRRLVS